MRVLVIEPDKILAKIYLQQLLLAGLEVLIARDGQMAVHAIDEQKPDVIVAELQLGAHSGIEFLHELRSYEDWANIPVIINSSVPKTAFGVSEAAWHRLGVTRYFYKPKTTAKQLIGAILALDESA
jgi:CheY-like chemotaxis protein